MTDDSDFQALVPSSKVKAAGGTAAITGFWMLLFANQTFNIIRFEGIFAVIILLKFVFAVTFLVFAFQIFKLRLWGIYGTVAVGALTALLTAGWLVFTFMNSVFSFMPLMVIPCAAVTAVLAWLARADVTRAEKERAKMQDGGLDLGV